MKRQLKAALRAALGERGRALVTRASWALGRRPHVNRAAAHALRFPGGRRAALVLSADFELAWAWRYARGLADPVGFARRRAQQGRRNMRPLLELCDRFELPVTWATVGHLFLDGCRRSDGRTHTGLPRLPHFESDWWAYRQGDWFDADPACAGPSEPEWFDWYAPDLLRSILQRPVGHEIGCHTFSHVPFSDSYCPAEVATAELLACAALARDWGLTLRSFVFPGNVPGNHASLRSAGFTAYRMTTPYELDLPRRDELGMWQVPGTFIEHVGPWSAAEQTRRLRRYVDSAVEHGLLCSFWFHPETDPHNVEAIFPDLFSHIASRRSEVWVTTMGSLARWLDHEAALGTAPTSGGAAARA